MSTRFGVGLGLLSSVMLGLLSHARAEEPPAASGAPPCSHVEALDFAVLGEPQLLLLRIRVEVEGQSVANLWDSTFERLLAFHDRNGDAAIDAQEMTHLPSPLALRQVLWGQFLPSASSGSSWEGRTGKYGRDGLFRLYRQAGLGNALVGVGQPPATETLTDSLLKHLDRDGDQRVVEAEWKAAPELLAKLDRNDDELIGPGELAANVIYPGASGTALLSAPSPHDSSTPCLEKVPLLVLPSVEADTHWTGTLLKRRDQNEDGRLDAHEAGLSTTRFALLDRDKNGGLTPDELARWRNQEPDLEWRIGLGGEKAKGAVVIAESPHTLEAGRLRLELRSGEGELPTMAKAAREYLSARFADADTDHDGVVDASDFASGSMRSFRPLLETADQNGDGRLKREELETWLDLQEGLAKSHVLITVLDHGAGLFELLDIDRDGALSLRELRGAWNQVRAGGCLMDGGFDRKTLPRQLVATVSLGHPRSSLANARPALAPRWFQAMDRNGDGDLSRREFVGPEAEFLKLDTDHDGLVGPSEAQQNTSAK